MEGQRTSWFWVTQISRCWRIWSISAMNEGFDWRRKLPTMMVAGCWSSV
jgi:hypothetical protein